ncbi:hypothetical protein [Capnocytophaga leadbetteri]|nr:hypothetical protein [Capnocytophaga leadbetteri]
MGVQATMVAMRCGRASDCGSNEVQAAQAIVRAMGAMGVIS